METLWLYKFNSKDDPTKIGDGLSRCFDAAGGAGVFEKGDLAAIKVHFGEAGNSTFLPPTYAKRFVQILQGLGVRPFVTDSNVLYKSRRDNAYDHLILAREHGYSLDTLGAPVIIADGITGQNERDVVINAPMNKTVSLASDFITADAYLVMTHATGHLATGLGATIKNLGMGMASRRGKLRQHSVSKPVVDREICQVCERCVEFCPANAITMHENYAEISEGICIGCGECLAACRKGAVAFKWDSGPSNLQKQIAEHALGALHNKKEKAFFVTFLTQMTKDCDCLAQPAKFVLEDIGVLMGHDPVAIDQAVLNLTGDNHKANIATMSYPKLDPTIQLAYGEEIGLGSREYHLQTVE